MTLKFSEKILKWYKVHGRKDLPWKVNDPYKIWISEVMLQQTQVSTVIPYYKKFLAKYPTLESLSKANYDDLMLLWSGLGYYRRIKNIFLASKLISEKFHNKFPQNYDDIIALPGIGRTTASAISTFSGFSNKAILDGNVKRILRRFFDISSDVNAANEKKLWIQSESVTPAKKTSEFIQGMMDIGSSICTRNNPKCNICPLRELNCLYNPKIKNLPITKNKNINITMYLLIIINSKNMIYLKKIISGKLWLDLYASPMFGSEKDLNNWKNQNIDKFKSNHNFQIIHKVTNKNIIFKSSVYHLKNDKSVSLSSKNWYNLANINVGIPKFMEKVIGKYRSEYENNHVQETQ